MVSSPSDLVSRMPQYVAAFEPVTTKKRTGRFSVGSPTKSGLHPGLATSHRRHANGYFEDLFTRIEVRLGRRHHVLSLIELFLAA
jgi:hypothetical protein